MSAKFIETSLTTEDWQQIEWALSRAFGTINVSDGRLEHPRLEKIRELLELVRGNILKNEKEPAQG